MCDGKQIYVIKHPDLYQKVGVSNHPEKRFEQLQQGCPYELELIGAVDVVDDTNADS